MSTHWGYYCTTCAVESDKWLNHGERVLAGLIPLAAHLSGIRASDVTGYIDISVMGANLGDGPDPIEFLEQHPPQAGHDVSLLNEYGARREVKTEDTPR